MRTKSKNKIRLKERASTVKGYNFEYVFINSKGKQYIERDIARYIRVYNWLKLYQ